MGPSRTGVAGSWVSGRGAAFWSLDSENRQSSAGGECECGPTESGFLHSGNWGGVGRVRILDSWILETGRAGEGVPWAVQGYWILGFWNLAVGRARETLVLPAFELTLPDRACEGEHEFEKGNIRGRRRTLCRHIFRALLRTQGQSSWTPCRPWPRPASLHHPRGGSATS